MPRYLDYQATFWWFEVAQLARKLLLCSVVQLVAPGEATQVLVATVFCTLYLACVAYFSPYEDPADSFFSIILQALWAVGLCFVRVVAKRVVSPRPTGTPARSRARRRVLCLAALQCRAVLCPDHAPAGRWSSSLC